MYNDKRQWDGYKIQWYKEKIICMRAVHLTFQISWHLRLSVSSRLGGKGDVLLIQEITARFPCDSEILWPCVLVSVCLFVLLQKCDCVCRPFAIVHGSFHRLEYHPNAAEKWLFQNVSISLWAVVVVFFPKELYNIELYTYVHEHSVTKVIKWVQCSKIADHVERKINKSFCKLGLCGFGFIY